MGWGNWNQYTNARTTEQLLERSYKDKKGHGAYCPVCQQVITLVSDACPICGHKMSGTRPGVLKIIFSYVLTFVIVAGLLVLVTSTLLFLFTR